MLCVASIASTHLLGAGFMLMLIYYPHVYHDAEKTHQRATLERCSRCLTVDPPLCAALADDPCIICFDSFDVGQSTRRLSPRSTQSPVISHDLP